MGTARCIYYGYKEEDIMIDFTDHKVVFAKEPEPAMTGGCRLGSVMGSYTFLTNDAAEDLGIELITAARKARQLREKEAIS